MEQYPLFDQFEENIRSALLSSLKADLKLDLGTVDILEVRVMSYQEIYPVTVDPKELYVITTANGSGLVILQAVKDEAGQVTITSLAVKHTRGEGDRPGTEIVKKEIVLGSDIIFAGSNPDYPIHLRPYADKLLFAILSGGGDFDADFRIKCTPDERGNGMMMLKLRSK